MDRIVLNASEGHVLTNGLVYGKKVFLSKDTDADNWREITEAEYKEIMAKQEEAM